MKGHGVSSRDGVCIGVGSNRFGEGKVICVGSGHGLPCWATVLTHDCCPMHVPLVSQKRLENRATAVTSAAFLTPLI